MVVRDKQRENQKVLRGLTQQEAARRLARGEGNDADTSTSRTYAQIIRQNVFTFVNMVLFIIGVVLIALELYTDALMSVGIVLMNVMIGVVQEARAKRQLDQIALLTRPRAMVIRDEQEQVVDPAQIVLGDLLVVQPGDQIVVDGQVKSGKIEVDESLLTGEADLIPKKEGDSLLSGSYCVTGRAVYEAQRVGINSFANQITAGARVFKMDKTPLQTDIDLVVRILVLVVIQIGILLGLVILVGQLPATTSARIAAVITGLIPNGLFFMITIAYAMGAVRMAGQGALIQQSNAVESMSNVDVLCLDKTGTLTANRIHLQELHPYDLSEDDLRAQLGHFAASVTSRNRTLDAIREACSGDTLPVSDEVIFSSKLKWSALSIDQESMHGVYVLGAAEMLEPYLAPGTDLGEKVQAWSDEGLRVLLFARYPLPVTLHDAVGQPHLPVGLEPLGLISLSDELRPEARETLAGFAKAGIRLKIISGDNPHTVAALARQAGLPPDMVVISGVELAQMDEAQFERAAVEATIFGRITPQQKEQLVHVLAVRGHYVAMIGDGVNDVLSLKKAQIGIAMQSGSDATRGVADIILLNDSFAALPASFMEGQRIINGMQDILRLFLVRVFAMTLIIVGVGVVRAGFPFSPINSSLMTLLTVGIPTFALAAWARPGMPTQGLIRSVLHFVIPATFTVALAGMLVYIFFFLTTFQDRLGVPVNTPQEAIALEAIFGRSVEEVLAEVEAEATLRAQTALTALMTACGLILIVFVEPPTHFLVGGDAYSGDWRPTILAVVLFACFVGIMIVPELRDFFELAAMSARDVIFVTIVVAVWCVLQYYTWRTNIFDRFLNIDLTSATNR